MRSISTVATALLIAAAGSPTAAGATPPVAAPVAAMARQEARDSAEAHRAVVRFLAVFDSLQWEPFRAYLAEDVTVFAFNSGAPTRLDGRAAVEAWFGRMFERVRATRASRGETGPISMGIAPRVRDLRLQFAGSAAIVSFRLGDESPARRSLVFRREPDGMWRVVHWHASSAPAATPARPSGAARSGPTPAAPEPAAAARPRSPGGAAVLGESRRAS